MIIQKNDFNKMFEFLKEVRSEGEKYVAFEDHSPVNTESVKTFTTAYEAQEFCYENATGDNVFSYLSISSACQAMAAALKDETLLICKDGLVDISLTTLLWVEQSENEQPDIDHKQKNMFESFQTNKNRKKYEVRDENKNERSSKQKNHRQAKQISNVKYSRKSTKNKGRLGF
ncbi:hypothetical protein [Sphingobacterium sp. DR205]|uniref:hypothetical protein n=1 Tax=Sphingobacterium sp. DR205 TaxID=2713573 RepID=UPI0013E4C947|nr:hypothetical protein [Sphingobacterium sp. DR205]QIH34514.1 hypothetical protein G6053_17165 [Sphingobacterium sp. DR205]